MTAQVELLVVGGGINNAASRAPRLALDDQDRSRIDHWFMDSANPRNEGTMTHE